MSVKMTKLVCLDAATRYTGYAAFNKGKLMDHKNIVSRIPDTHQRIHDIAMKSAEEVVRFFHGTRGVVLIEYPSFQSNTRGIVASLRGNTLVLSELCGAIAMTLQGEAEIHYVTFNQWNGQLTKDITCRRLKKHYGLEANPKSVDNNWADAVMMGHWWLNEGGEDFVARHHCLS